MNFQRLLVNFCFGLLLVLCGCATTFAIRQGTSLRLPERVLVIYNTNAPASLEVADYYLSKRGIPNANKCAISPSDAASVDWNDFETKVRAPIRTCLKTVGQDQILYIVFAYQTPFRILNVPTITGRELRALDSFIAAIWNDQTLDVTEITSHSYFAEMQSQGNVYPPFVSLADYRNQPDAELLYSVWRLDAATADLAKGLVDKSLQVEANGLQGQGCFDRRFGVAATLEDWSYGAGDWDVFRAADFAKKAGIAVTEDEQGAEFGTAPAPLRCENVALYAGWYSYNHYNDAFSWATGAIGFHLDSGSALDPRGGANWSANALQRGITVTSGAVNEPYLEGLPHADGVFRNLFAGANVGDAFLRNTAFLQWMVINLGDPLYRPFPAGRPPFNVPSFAQNSFALDSPFVIGGKTITATISLAAPAPAGGLDVQLTNARPGAVTVPDTIRFAAGTTQATFPIASAITPNYQPSLITATINNETFANTLTVAPLLAAINFEPSTVAGDTVRTGTIFLNDFAPTSGAIISLTSDQPAVIAAPSTVIVAEGQARATFTVTIHPVAAKTTVLLIASHNGAREMASVMVTPTTRRTVPIRRPGPVGN
ncbi:MAG: TIGR03790 family protein [Blastocatellia bacterium]|nr:TIGR03790 family protein [Blastocatellia bacterium]